MPPVDWMIRLLMLAVAALPTLAGTAAAVPYQWRDDQGRMVYSDLPPPASIAAKRIIRSPPPPVAGGIGRAGDTGSRGADSGTKTGFAGTATGETVVASTGESAGAGTAGTANAAKAGAIDTKAATADAVTTNADRELAYRKREIERAEREKKESEESTRKLELARACSDAQGDIRTLLSGQRISRIDPSGERAYLSDEERAERLKAARKSVGEHC